jgi:DNA-binding response OmpR family regulator
MTKKVLLCDDEVHILRTAEIKVQRAGYDVRVASDGQQAWEMIQAEMPDILVTDVQMPRLDGLALVKRLRENPATHDLPVLMLTAKGYELSHAELAEHWQVASVLTKPFSPRELVEVIERTLASSAATI